MWSYVGKKTNPRWLWHAINEVNAAPGGHLRENVDRRTGQVLAYVFGRRKDKAFLQLKRLLEPFGIKRYCTDGWGAHKRHLPVESHEIGRRKTQRIEQKNLRMRTRIKRLVRKTTCFSKTEEMHGLIIGLFINRYRTHLRSLRSSKPLEHQPNKAKVELCCSIRQGALHCS